MGEGVASGKGNHTHTHTYTLTHTLTHTKLNLRKASWLLKLFVEKYKARNFF